MHLVLGGIAMTYYARIFFVEARQRQIEADYLRAIREESLRVKLGRAFVAIGATVRQRPVTFDEPVSERQNQTVHKRKRLPHLREPFFDGSRIC